MNQFKNFKSNFSQFSCKSIPVKLQKTFLICAHICYKSFTMSHKYLICFSLSSFVKLETEEDLMLQYLVSCNFSILEISRLARTSFVKEE